MEYPGSTPGYGAKLLTMQKQEIENIYTQIRRVLMNADDFAYAPSGYDTRRTEIIKGLDLLRDKAISAVSDETIKGSL